MNSVFAFLISVGAVSTVVGLFAASIWTFLRGSVGVLELSIDITNFFSSITLVVCVIPFLLNESFLYRAGDMSSGSDTFWISMATVLLSFTLLMSVTTRFSARYIGWPTKKWSRKSGKHLG